MKLSRTDTWIPIIGLVLGTAIYAPIGHALHGHPYFDYLDHAYFLLCGAFVALFRVGTWI